MRHRLSNKYKFGKKFCATAQISCNSKTKCANLIVSLAPKKNFGADSNSK